ncbi:isochorismate synthase [Hyunsoonleella flava]|uniref:Isochorismate synthase n=1 Tax=Hyunsoonleella flava TaxID=2527939 RepID=A0A4Q9FJR8_9FLAO|nr:chorismate-binding protein [Hyunsoonleella flava]TBN04436.1 isochorismate synthase [Hyunsoonleella flava]
MQHFFERLERHLKNNLPFVVYRKPNNIALKAILQQDDELHKVKGFNKTGFVFSPFDNSADSILIPLSVSETIVFSEITNDKGNQTSEVISKVNSEAKEFHLRLVDKGIRAIKNDEFQKVVLSRKEICDFKDGNPLTTFKKLLNAYQSAFVYCWYHPKIGLWLGATPETLLKIEGKQFSMMSLAGTQDYKGDLNVKWKQKELQEQQFVTDFILESIKDVVDNIQVSNVETVKAGNLLHLRTLIKGVLNETAIDFERLLYSLHPTPAVCGMPKTPAKAFILKHENYNREFYTGFLGELNFETEIKPRTGQRNIENRAYTLKRKSTQLYVNLRCLQIKGDTAFVYVGGGITETSNPESEWEETVAKSKVVKKVL